MKYTKQEIEQAREYLHGYIKPGDKVYTILRQVSRSGMSRHISVLVKSDEGMHEVTHLVAKVLGERRNNDDGGLVVSGCGMDMGFEVVYRLGFALWPTGFDCIGQGCQSNDHLNYYNFTNNGGKLPDHTCLDHIKQTPGICHDLNCIPWHHGSGGYALRQEWL